MIRIERILVETIEPEHKALLVHKVQQAHKAHKVHQEPTELMELMGLKAHQVLLLSIIQISMK